MTTTVPRRQRTRAVPVWPALLIGALVLATGLRSGPADPERPEPRDAASPEADSGADDAHGRHAKSPAQIPARGWWDILKRVYQEFAEDRVLAVAAGVTFYGLLAVFPTIAALVSLYGLIADPSTIGSQLDSLSGVLPGGAIDIIGEQIKRITAKPAGSLSFALVAGLAISLWSSNAGMKAMFDALNVVYDETEARGFVLLNAISLLFTVCALAILIAALGAVVVVPVVFNVVGLGGERGAELVALARWPLLLLVVALALSVLYRFGPSRAKAKWRWITWGSAFAALAWLTASALFSFYVSKFGNYNATYGSLGAAIGFMTWMWISCIVILLGAEISAEIEHQTEMDTTAGPDRPAGSRGATMADEIGRAA